MVIGSNRWQQVETFDQLRIPQDDPNILLSFHFYTPMALTHYGASWNPIGRYQGPVHYPGRVVQDQDLAGLPDDLVSAIRDGRALDFDRAALAALLAKPLALARRTGLPLYCGEWGALPARAPRAPAALVPRRPLRPRRARHRLGPLGLQGRLRRGRFRAPRAPRPGAGAAGRGAVLGAV